MQAREDTMKSKITLILIITFKILLQTSWAEDDRILLKIPFKSREDFLRGMRQNNGLMEKVLRALSKKDFKQVEKIASVWLLDVKKAKNLPYRYDPNFIALAVDFHTNGTVEIIKAARSKNMEATLSSLANFYGRCNACHETYRVIEWPENKTYPNPTAQPLNIPKNYNYSDWATK